MPLDPALAPVLARIGTWSAQAQAQALTSLRNIEMADLQQQGAEPLNPAARAAVQEGLAQFDRRQFADDQVAKLYRDYKL